MAGALSAAASVVSIAGGVKSLFSSEPSEAKIPSAKPFKKPITTPGFTFGSGILARRSDFVSGEETRLRGLIGENRLGIGGLRDQIAQQRQLGGEFAGLRGQVTPGFGRLTESLVLANRNRQAEEAGNLRESLRDRRVLGSSFGNAALQSLGLTFAQEEERIRAESFIAELDLSRSFILDQATLDLNLNSQDAALLNQQLQTIQTEAALLQTQIARELTELDLATSFLAVVNQKIIDGTADDQEAAADAFDPLEEAVEIRKERGGGGAGGGGAGNVGGSGTEGPSSGRSETGSEPGGIGGV